MAKVTVNWAEVFATAHAAGMAAVEKCVPVPMNVVERENPFDDRSAIVRQYEPIADGVCGFAWVNIRPANSAAAKFAIERFGARKDSYEGGVCIWIHQFNQSMAKKEAYAHGFAKVLTEAGVRCYASSRMD